MDEAEQFINKKIEDICSQEKLPVKEVIYFFTKARVLLLTFY